MTTRVAGVLLVCLAVDVHRASAQPSPPPPSDIVEVSQVDAHTAAYVAAVTNRTHTERTYEDAVLMAYVNRTFEQNPNASAFDVLATLNAAKAQYRRQFGEASDAGNFALFRSNQDAVNSMFNVLGQIPGAASTSALARESATWMSRLLDSSLAPAGQIMAQHNIYHSAIYADAFLEQEVTTGLQLASSNETARQVIDTFFGTQWGVFTTQSTDSILHDPGFGNNPAIEMLQQRLQANGTILVSLKDLADASKQQGATLNESIQQNTSLLATISRDQQSLISYVNQWDKRAVQIDPERRQAELDDLRLRGASAAVYLLSTFAKSNPAVSRAISVAGTTAISIVRSLRQYGRDTATGGDGFPFGAVVLSGDIIGGALNLMSLVGMGGPTPEELILEQLHALRDQIKDLHQEMSERFDRIDSQFGELFAILTANFDNLNFRLNELNRSVQVVNARLQNVEAQLFDAQASIYQLEHRVHAYFEDQARHEFSEHVDQCFAHGQQPPVLSFGPCESFFYLRAAENAKTDRIAIGPDINDRSVDDDKLAQELSAFEPVTNLNYLLNILRMKIPNSELPTATVANPIDWAIAADVYVRLCIENLRACQAVEANDQANQTSRVKSMIAVGQDVARAVSALSMKPSQSGPSNAANYALYGGLLKNYRAKAQAMIKKLRSVENDWVHNSAGDVHPWDLSAPQDIPATIGTGFLDACDQSIRQAIGNSAVKMLTPVRVEKLFPNEFRIAQAWGLGSFTWGCFDIPRVTVRPDKVRLILTANYRGKLVFRRQIETERNYPQPGEALLAWASGTAECDTTYPRSCRQPDEAPLRDTFVDRSKQIAPDSELAEGLSTVRTDIKAKVITHRTSLYTALLQNLFEPGSLPGNPTTGQLSREAKELDGAKALILAVATMGLGRRLAADDYLRSFLLAGKKGEPLFGAVEIADRYRAAAAPVEADKPVDDADITRQVELEMNRRMDAFERALGTALDGLSRGAERESLGIVDSSLLRLSSLVALTRTGTGR